MGEFWKMAALTQLPNIAGTGKLMDPVRETGDIFFLEDRASLLVEQLSRYGIALWKSVPFALVMAAGLLCIYLLEKHIKNWEDY